MPGSSSHHISITISPIQRFKSHLQVLPRAHSHLDLRIKTFASATAPLPLPINFPQASPGAHTRQPKLLVLATAQQISPDEFGKSTAGNQDTLSGTAEGTHLVAAWSASSEVQHSAPITYRSTRQLRAEASRSKCGQARQAGATPSCHRASYSSSCWQLLSFSCPLGCTSLVQHIPALYPPSASALWTKQLTLRLIWAFCTSIQQRNPRPKDRRERDRTTVVATPSSRVCLQR